MGARRHSRDDPVSFPVDLASDVLYNMPSLDIELAIEEIGVLPDRFSRVTRNFLLQFNEIEDTSSSGTALRTCLRGEG